MYLLIIVETLEFSKNNKNLRSFSCQNTSHLEDLFEKQDLYFYDYQYLIHKIILYYFLNLTIDKEYINKLNNI